MTRALLTGATNLHAGRMVGRVGSVFLALLWFGCGAAHEVRDAAQDAEQDADEGTVGVGDRCIPEWVPVDGFRSSESYIETSSVQCATRACLVYRLDGHPERIVGTDACPAGPASSSCVEAREVEARVFCSCRCSVPDGTPDAPLCTCGDGFHCVELLGSGSASVRGSYCLRETFCEEDIDCASGQACLDHICS
jgi:hypothetical protein